MKKKQKIILITLLGIFITIAICVSLGLTQNLDDAIYEQIKKIQNEKLTTILIFITNLGGISCLFFITTIIVILLCTFKQERMGIGIALNILTSSAVYVLLKNIFRRPRPEIGQRLVTEIGYSFPSGHTLNNVAFYGLAIYLIYKNVKNKKVRNAIIIVLRDNTNSHRI